MTLSAVSNGIIESEGDVFDKTRRRLVNISPEAYRHPMDKQATAALRAVPGFEYAVRKLSRYSLEQILYLEMCASAVKVTPKQCSRIHRLLVEAVAVLDLPTVPALFLTQTPIVNAFAMGRENPTVVLHTGLVELLTEEELLGVIAHELGHVHCGHTVYRLMALLVELLIRYGGMKLGVGDILSMPIQASLLEWTRKAEFSADRAAILVTQNPEAVFSTLFKLTGGSPKIFNMMDRDEYLKQAEEYDRADTGRLDRFYKTLIEAGKTHPIPVLRARETLRYGESDEYKGILAGRYGRREKNGTVLVASGTKQDGHIKCPNCGEEADALFSFCTHCGMELKDVLAAAAASSAAATDKEQNETNA
ncbi:MAG: M48 family metalloprotease [Cytophagales bacterium]|nr:M48 family metalloprotease [Armatimonadota bacterium]